MMKRNILLLVMVLSGTVFLYPQEKPDKKKMREEKAEIAYESMKQLIEGGKYLIVSDRLVSARGYSKSIVTTPNYIQVEDGKANISLPYFGEVRANTPYMPDQGIKYEGPVQDYSMDLTDSKHRITVKFDIDRSIEEHNFIITIGKSGQARVKVISSGRTGITYYGKVEPVAESTDRS